MATTITLPPDPYKILGVSKDAQIPEIRSAHRKLVLRCHPDKVQDPQLKELKQIEFQRVQQAYELLSNELEREKYDKMVEYQALKEQIEKAKNAAAPASSNRSPKRETTASYDVKEATPRPTTFAKASPYPRTPPRSYEDNSSNFFEPFHQARKTASYEKERPSRREEERRRREKDEEWPRAKEKDRVKEKEKKEKSREEKERRDKDEKRERRDKEKKKSSPEKDRRRGSDEKRRHNHQPYVEASPDEAEEAVFSSSYKSDKKKSNSNRRHDEPRDTSRPPAASERERKHSANMEFAQRYMQRSGGLAGMPGLTRASTFQEESFSRHAPVAVPTPPPANAAAYPPPPKQDDRDITVEEDTGRRPLGRGAGRHMSFSKDKPHKKSGAPREAPVMSDGETPTSRPMPAFKKSHSNPLGLQSDRVPLGRSNTDTYSRPIPGALDRSQTWYPGADRERERSRSRHGRHERAVPFSDEDSDDERDHRHRRDRRNHSPGTVPLQTTTYRVDKNKSIPIRPIYPEDNPRAYKGKGNGSTRIERNNYSHTYGDYDEAGPYFSKVKYATQFDPNDVTYSNVPYATNREVLT